MTKKVILFQQLYIPRGNPSLHNNFLFIFFPHISKECKVMLGAAKIKILCFSRSLYYFLSLFLSLPILLPLSLLSRLFLSACFQLIFTFYSVALKHLFFIPMYSIYIQPLYWMQYSLLDLLSISLRPFFNNPMNCQDIRTI